jgi:hypothetical protein
MLNLPGYLDGGNICCTADRPAANLVQRKRCQRNGRQGS